MLKKPIKVKVKKSKIESAAMICNLSGSKGVIQGCLSSQSWSLALIRD